MKSYLPIKGESKSFVAEEKQIGRGNFQKYFVDVGKDIVKELTQRQWVEPHLVTGYLK